MGENNKKSIMEDLRFTIQQAQEITRLYGNQVRQFLEINIAILTVYSILLVFFIDIFNTIGDFAIILAFSWYSYNTFQNIKQNLKENKTEGTNKALCSYREWKKGELSNELNKVNDPNYFLIEYKTEIENLHIYQTNYSNLAEKTRIRTYKGIKILIIGIILSLIIGIIGNIIGIYFKIGF